MQRRALLFRLHGEVEKSARQLSAPEGLEKVEGGRSKGLKGSRKKAGLESKRHAAHINETESAAAGRFVPNT